MKKLKPLVLASICSALAVSAFAAAPAPQSATETKERSRLEELFIWRTSEELRLAPSDEQKFTEAIHTLNQRRRDANTRMDNALQALAAAKTRAEAEKALAAHRAALRDTQAVQNAELDKLRPLLGPVKLAQYLVAKNTILEKLKAMLAAPAVATDAVAPAAKAAGTASGMTAPIAK